MLTIQADKIDNATPTDQLIRRLAELRDEEYAIRDILLDRGIPPHSLPSGRPIRTPRKMRFDGMKISDCILITLREYGPAGATGRELTNRIYRDGYQYSENLRRYDEEYALRKMKGEWYGNGILQDLNRLRKRGLITRSPVPGSTAFRYFTAHDR